MSTPKRADFVTKWRAALVAGDVEHPVARGRDAHAVPEKRALLAHGVKLILRVEALERLPIGIRGRVRVRGRPDPVALVLVTVLPERLDEDAHDVLPALLGAGPEVGRARLAAVAVREAGAAAEGKLLQ